MAGFRVSGQGGGVIQGTASEAVLVVLLAARDQVLRRVGKDATGKLVVYCSDQTHSALQKACKVNSNFYAPMTLSYAILQLDIHSVPIKYINISPL